MFVILLNLLLFVILYSGPPSIFIIKRELGNVKKNNVYSHMYFVEITFNAVKVIQFPAVYLRLTHTATYAIF